MSHILISYSLKDPDHIGNIGEPAFEDVFHINFFSSDIFSPKETDVEEIDFSYDVRECDNHYSINYTFLSSTHYRLVINHNFRFVRSKGIQ